MSGLRVLVRVEIRIRVRDRVGIRDELKSVLGARCKVSWLGF